MVIFIISKLKKVIINIGGTLFMVYDFLEDKVFLDKLDNEKVK